MTRILNIVQSKGKVGPQKKTVNKMHVLQIIKKWIITLILVWGENTLRHKQMTEFNMKVYNYSLIWASLVAQQ